MNTRTFILENRDKIIEIARQNGVVSIKLFGSVARQEDTENNDVDFLVEFEEGRSLFGLIQIKQDLQKLLNRTVHIISEDSLHKILKEEIEKEEWQGNTIIIYEVDKEKI
ncbi:nucleotidyltransferase family protein [Anaerosolibacter sp.]|uniref:nucleotidyltransferase family protein n=1 Tax=Anaerosolibacter sp. TaxID=1872527 RepID=UPI0039F08815